MKIIIIMILVICMPLKMDTVLEKQNIQTIYCFELPSLTILESKSIQFSMIILVPKYYSMKIIISKSYINITNEEFVMYKSFNLIK